MRQTLEKGWQDFYDVKDYKPIKTANIPKGKPIRMPWEELGMTKEQYDNLFSK